MFERAFQAVAQEVPLPEVATELSTYQVAALAENSVKDKTDTKNLITWILTFELIPKGLEATTFQLCNKDQPHEKQLFIIDVALL
jgi:hypothetical protein